VACLVPQAMRQDLTVQHLRNELAVRIYQAHARAALEYGDSAEYNQCQTQLNVLAVEVSWWMAGRVPMN
jgi:SAC3 family protein LENG8/THP3